MQMAIHAAGMQKATEAGKVQMAHPVVILLMVRVPTPTLKEIQALQMQKATEAGKVQMAHPVVILLMVRVPTPTLMATQLLMMPKVIWVKVKIQPVVMH
jgi:hypothetical protein